MATEDVDIGNVREPLSSFAVVFTIIYMLLLTNYHAYTDNNIRYEDLIDCTCRHNDEAFYTAIFSILTALWGIVVLFWFGIRLFSFLLDHGFITSCNMCSDYQHDEDVTFCECAQGLLELLSLPAHLAVLPLLFLQFLSTYAWVCMFGDKYCSDGDAPDQLQLDRTGVLCGFLFCAIVITFTTNMIGRCAK